MANLSKRVLEIQEPQTIGMSRKSRELKAKGLDVISLSLGEPDFFTPDYIKEAAVEAINKNHSYYTPVAGVLELREAICRKFKRDNQLEYSPDQILVSTGAKQCLANAILTLIDPGDEVIIPAPFWVTYVEQVRLAGGIPVLFETKVENGLKITPEELESLITEKSKLFMFSSPSNPTGSIYSKAELESLAAVFAKHPQITVISDEIYELISYEEKPTSFATIPGMYDRTITINGLSKGFAMTGYRLGYMAGPADIIRAADKIQGQFTSGTNSITQQAAITALDESPERVSHMVAEFKKRRDAAFERLQKIPHIEVAKPTGAFYFFPNVEYYLGKSFNGKVMENSTDLCTYLLEEGLVATVPGDAFGQSGHIRLSYATSEEILAKAIERIENALQKLQ